MLAFPIFVKPRRPIFLGKYTLALGSDLCPFIVFNSRQLDHIYPFAKLANSKVGENGSYRRLYFVFQLHGTPTTVGSPWTA